MQLTVAEDLLRNTENLAVAIGDVLDVTSGNISNSSMTISQENIGTYSKYLYVPTYVHASYVCTYYIQGCVNHHCSVRIYVHTYIA